MKIKILFFLTVLFVYVDDTIAQVGAVPNNIRATNTLDQLSNDGRISTSELLYGIPVPPGEVIGDTYLSEEWRRTSILLYTNDKLIEGYRCRYNIFTNQLETQANNAIRALEGKNIRSFVWKDNKTDSLVFYVNSQDFRFKESPQTGFFQVLKDGKMPLFKKTSIVIRKPDYKPEFAMGNRDTQILKKEDYFAANGNDLVEITRSKKKFLEIFGSSSAEVNDFIKARDLNITNENHLVLIFTYYNSKSD